MRMMSFALAFFVSTASLAGVAKENKTLPGDLSVQKIQYASLSETQRQQFMSIVDAAIRIVSGQGKLESEDAKQTFGRGEFFWPKIGGAPVSRYYDEIEIGNFQIDFKKNKQKTEWTRCGITIQPLMFPKSIFDINLPSSFFREFELEERYKKTIEDQSTPEVTYVYPIRDEAFFVYRTHGLLHDVRIRFSTSQRVVDIKRDLYPKRFYAVSIERIDN